MFAELFQSAFCQKPLKKSKLYFFPLERYCLNTNKKKTNKKYHHPTRDKNDDFQNLFFVILGVFSSKNALIFFWIFCENSSFFHF